MALEGLVLAEGLCAGRVVAAAVALLALVDEAVALEALAGGEALAAVGAGEAGLLGVRGEDVALQVLVVGVGLVAVRVGAPVGALVVVGAQVGDEARRPVELLVAAGDGAGDGLELRGELAAAGGGRRVGRYGRGCLGVCLGGNGARIVAAVVRADFLGYRVFSQ